MCRSNRCFRPDRPFCVQGLQGQGASALQKVLPQEMFLDLRMGSQVALLVMDSSLLNILL